MGKSRDPARKLHKENTANAQSGKSGAATGSSLSEGGETPAAQGQSCTAQPSGGLRR